MEDSDDVRGLIERRLKELGLEHTVVSVQIGKGRTYLYDYFSKRSPKTMPSEQKLLLAPILGVHPRMLGVSPLDHSAAAGGGLADDAVPYVPGPNSPTPALHTMPYRMRTKVLDQYPEADLRPGRVPVFNVNLADPTKIPSGSVVIAQVFGRDDLMHHKGTVVRQFLAPNKLVTNSSEHNEILTLDDPDEDLVVIQGTMVYVMSEVAENGNRSMDQTVAVTRDQHERTKQ